MADEDMMEMDELADDEEEAESTGGGNPLMKYLPWIVGLLVIQVVLAYLVAQWFFVPEAVSEEEVATEMVAPGEAEAQEGYEPPPTEVVMVYQALDVVVVNPAGTDGLRFLSTKVDLGLSNPDVALFIENNNLKSRINDTMISLLQSKTIPYLTNPPKQQELKEEIKERLNGFLGENAVLEIYFQSFVMQ